MNAIVAVGFLKVYILICKKSCLKGKDDTDNCLFLVMIGDKMIL